jgi:hypothetical protein
MGLTHDVAKFVVEKGFNDFSKEDVKVAKELNEIRMEEVEVGPYEKVKLDLNDKTLEGALSPNDLAVLEPFVEITEPKEFERLSTVWDSLLQRKGENCITRNFLRPYLKLEKPTKNTN